MSLQSGQGAQTSSGSITVITPNTGASGGSGKLVFSSGTAKREILGLFLLELVRPLRTGRTVECRPGLWHEWKGRWHDFNWWQIHRDWRRRVHLHRGRNCHL